MGAPFNDELRSQAAWEHNVLLADTARAMHMRRMMKTAYVHGFDILDALGLSSLALDILDDVIGAFDVVDGDPDLEDGHDAEHDTSDAEEDLGWSALHSQVHLGSNTPDGDLTALERHGRGFLRSGHDDAEDDDGCGDEDSGVGDADGMAEQLAGWSHCPALNGTVGGYVD